jgi:hypothetical protein
MIGFYDAVPQTAVEVMTYEVESAQSERSTITPSKNDRRTSVILLANIAEQTEMLQEMFSQTFSALSEAINTHADIITAHIENMSTDTNIINQPLREVIPRMPWHDVHACLSGLSVRDMACHFVQVQSIIIKIFSKFHCIYVYELCLIKMESSSLSY